MTTDSTDSQDDFETLLQTWEAEFTKWMREPEQYRHLMTDRVNDMMSTIRTLWVEKRYFQDHAARLEGENMAMDERIRTLERENHWATKCLGDNGIELDAYIAFHS